MSVNCFSEVLQTQERRLSVAQQKSTELLVYSSGGKINRRQHFGNYAYNNLYVILIKTLTTAYYFSPVTT